MKVDPYTKFTYRWFKRISLLTILGGISYLTYFIYEKYQLFNEKYDELYKEAYNYTSPWLNGIIIKEVLRKEFISK